MWNWACVNVTLGNVGIRERLFAIQNEVCLGVSRFADNVVIMEEKNGVAFSEIASKLTKGNQRIR